MFTTRHPQGSGTYKVVYLGIDTLDGKEVAWSKIQIRKLSVRARVLSCNFCNMRW
jgi:hypothetical protein